MLTSTSQAGLLRLRLSTRQSSRLSLSDPFHRGPQWGQAGTVLLIPPNQVTEVMVAPSRKFSGRLRVTVPSRGLFPSLPHQPQGLRGATWPVLSLRGQAPHQPQPHICPCWATRSLRPRGHGQPRFDCSRVTSSWMLSQGSTLGPWN